MGILQPNWHYYRHSGVGIRAQIELPELGDPIVDPAMTADISILVEEVESEPAGDDAASHWNGEVLSFTVDDIGRWSISGGETIRIAKFAGASGTALRAFTLGSAWAAIGYQQGWPMLHGSCVEIAGKAIIFCGGQEQGKSTMAAALLARGRRLLVDDLARAELPEEGTRVRIYPSFPRLKLWRDAIERLAWHDRIAAQDDFRDQKFHLVVPRGSTAEPADLAAIVTLRWGEALTFERLGGAKALASTIAACTYRPEMLDVMGEHSAQAAKIAQIVSSTPVYRLTRPRDLRQLDEICEAIENHFCGAAIN